MPQSDTIKLISSHIVAVIIAIGGPILLVWLKLQGGSEVQDISTLIGGFVGLAIQFLFQTNAMAAARGTTRTDILTGTGSGGIVP